MPPCGLMVGRMTRRMTEEWKGELQSRLKGSSCQELAEERRIEDGVVDCYSQAHVSGHLVLTGECCFGRTLRGEDYL